MLPAAEPLRSCRVLLVEDNLDVAVVARDYLEQCGCEVASAASGEAAIDLLKTDSRHRVDVVGYRDAGNEWSGTCAVCSQKQPAQGDYSRIGLQRNRNALAIAEGFLLLKQTLFAGNSSSRHLHRSP